MRTKLWLLGVLGGLLAVGCGGVRDVQAEKTSTTKTPSMDDDDEYDDEDEDEQEIDLSQVPDAVKQAAQAAVSGLVLRAAEKETEDGTVVYSLEGTANGEAYEVEVSAAGKVLEIERGEEEDDD